MIMIPLEVTGYSGLSSFSGGSGFSNVPSNSIVYWPIRQTLRTFRTLRTFATTEIITYDA